MLTFYSDDPSSNPSEAYCFSVNLVIENNKNKQKEVRVGPFKTKQKLSMSFSSVRSPVGVFRRLTTFLRSHGRPESMTSAATFDDVTDVDAHDENFLFPTKIQMFGSLGVMGKVADLGSNDPSSNLANVPRGSLLLCEHLLFSAVNVRQFQKQNYL